MHKQTEASACPEPGRSRRCKLKQHDIWAVYSNVEIQKSAVEHTQTNIDARHAYNSYHHNMIHTRQQTSDFTFVALSDTLRVRKSSGK